MKTFKRVLLTGLLLSTFCLFLHSQKLELENIIISAGISTSSKVDMVGGSRHFPIKIIGMSDDNWGLSTGVEFWSMKVLDGLNQSRTANSVYWDFAAFYGGDYWLLRLGAMLPVKTTVEDLSAIGAFNGNAGLYGNIPIGDKLILSPFISYDLWLSDLEIGSILDPESVWIDLPPWRIGILLNYIIKD